MFDGSKTEIITEERKWKEILCTIPENLDQIKEVGLAIKYKPHISIGFAIYIGEMKISQEFTSNSSFSLNNISIEYQKDFMLIKWSNNNYDQLPHCHYVFARIQETDEKIYLGRALGNFLYATIQKLNPFCIQITTLDYQGNKIAHIKSQIFT